MSLRECAAEGQRPALSILLPRLATPDEAAAYPYTDAEREVAEGRLDGQALGSPDTVHKQLSELVSRTGADELMITTMVYDLEARARSFELVAELVRS